MEKLIWAWWAWILKEYLQGENEIENYKGKYFANKTIEKVNTNYNFEEKPISVFYPLTDNNVTTTFTTEKTTSTILSKLLNFYFSFRKQPTMKTFSLNNSTSNISETYLQNTSSIIINSGQLVNFSKPFFSSTLLTSLTSQPSLSSSTPPSISTTNYSSFSFVTVQPSVLKKNFINHVTAKTNSKSFQYQHNINETNHTGITDLFSMLKNSGKSSSSIFLNYNTTDTIMKSSNSTYALIRTQDLPFYQQNYVRNNSSSNWSLTSKIFSKIIDLYSALYNFSNFSLLSSSSSSITATTSSIISPRPEKSQSNVPNYKILMSFNETNTNSTIIEDIYKESESLFYDIILNCVNGNLTLDNCCNDFRSQTYSDNFKNIENNDIGSDLFLINSLNYNQTINCTSFKTISLGEYDSESPLQLISTFSTAIILGIIIFATVIGNVFVIAAILLEKNLQSVSNYLILSLAVADLLVACLVMPLSAVYEISQKWKMGPELCDMWTSTDVLCCTASILHLVAIALDRYWAVTNIDYIHQRTGRRIGIMIIIIWGLSFSVSIAPLLGWKDEKWHDRISKELKCIVSQDIGYQIFATASSFYVPLLVILVLYWRIFQTARKRIRRRQQVTGTPTVSGSLIATTTGSSGGIAAAVVTVIGKPLPTISETTTAFTNISSSHTSPEKGSYAMGMDNIENDLSTAEISTCGTEPGPIQSSELHGRKQGKLLTIKTTRLKIVRKKISTSVDSKRERKAAKTLAIITSAFVCCWLPFFALAILLPICQCNISPTVMSLSLWLGYFNSTLNPIIYTIFSPEFRHAFKRLLCGRRNSMRKHGRCLKR